MDAVTALVVSASNVLPLPTLTEVSSEVTEKAEVFSLEAGTSLAFIPFVELEKLARGAKS